MFKLTGFGDEISFYLEEQMDVLESEGIKHIELRGVGTKGVLDLHNEDIKEIKEQLDARGFAISAIASPIGKIGIEDDFDPHLERFKKAMDVAHAFETPYIERGYEGFLSLEPHLYIAAVSSGFSGPALFRTAAQALKKILLEIQAEVSPLLT